MSYNQLMCACGHDQLAHKGVSLDGQIIGKRAGRCNFCDCQQWRTVDISQVAPNVFGLTVGDDVAAEPQTYLLHDANDEIERLRKERDDAVDKALSLASELSNERQISDNCRADASRNAGELAKLRKELDDALAAFDKQAVEHREWDKKRAAEMGELRLRLEAALTAKRKAEESELRCAAELDEARKG